VGRGSVSETSTSGPEQLASTRCQQVRGPPPGLAVGSSPWYPRLPVKLRCDTLVSPSPRAVYAPFHRRLAPSFQTHLPPVYRIRTITLLMPMYLFGGFNFHRALGSVQRQLLDLRCRLRVPVPGTHYSAHSSAAFLGGLRRRGARPSLAPSRRMAVLIRPAGPRDSGQRRGEGAAAGDPLLDKVNMRRGAGGRLGWAAGRRNI